MNARDARRKVAAHVHELMGSYGRAAARLAAVRRWETRRRRWRVGLAVLGLVSIVCLFVVFLVGGAVSLGACLIGAGVTYLVTNAVINAEVS